MISNLHPATIMDTEVRDFPSSIMGINYQISTWFPPGYPELNRKYPVIYLLDGESFIGLVSGIAYGLVYGQVIPPCLIIGVGHHVASFEDWWQARAVDFNPPQNPNIAYPEWMKPLKNGRAPDFLSFLKNELIPFIEATYPVDSGERCLAGYSLGGKFCVYSLFHDPELFQKYLIGSGIWEHSLLEYLDYLEQFTRIQKSLPVHAFISVGLLEDDQAPYFPQFIKALEQMNFAGFRLETLILEGENHGSGAAIAYGRGIRALFSSTVTLA